MFLDVWRILLPASEERHRAHRDVAPLERGKGWPLDSINIALLRSGEQLDLCRSPQSRLVSFSWLRLILKDHHRREPPRRPSSPIHRASRTALAKAFVSPMNRAERLRGRLSRR